MVTFRKKGGHTTFRLPRALTADEFTLAHRAALREELDLHDLFSWNKILRVGLEAGTAIDSYFDAKAWWEPVEGFEKSIRPSEVWKQPRLQVLSDGELKCPAEYVGISITSKNAYSYPYMAVKTKLPSPDHLAYPEQEFSFGFRNHPMGGNGLAQFTYERLKTGTLAFWAFSGGNWADAFVGSDILNALPSDYATAYHDYAIIVTKPMVEFYIDGKLVAVNINIQRYAFGLGIFRVATYPPYAVSCVKLPPATSLLFSLELLGRQKELVVPLAPSLVSFGEGEPFPPRFYMLYVENTNTWFSGYTLDSGSVTSHPFPVFGYPNKTLFFQADQSGTLDIEVLTQTGNWRTYYSDTVSADELWWLKMTVDAVLARVTYTPTAYPATIAEAEVVLCG